MPGRHFLCGCDSEDPYVQTYRSRAIIVDGKETLTFKHFNKRGDEICPIHGMILKGSAFPVKQGPQGNDVPDHRKDFIRRYGAKPARGLRSSVEDRRDNRDPEEVGREFLAERESLATHITLMTEERVWHPEDGYPLPPIE